MKRLALCFTFLLMLSAAAFADDVITLKDGTTLEGHIVAQNPDGTRLLIGFGNKREPEWVSFSQIQSIRFGEVPVSAQSSVPADDPAS